MSKSFDQLFSILTLFKHQHNINLILGIYFQVSKVYETNFFAYQVFVLRVSWMDRMPNTPTADLYSVCGMAAKTGDAGWEPLIGRKPAPLQPWTALSSELTEAAAQP